MTTPHSKPAKARPHPKHLARKVTALIAYATGHFPGTMFVNTDVLSRLAVPVAVLPLDDYPALVEAITNAWLHNSSGTAKDLARTALAALGIRQAGKRGKTEKFSSLPKPSNFGKGPTIY